LVTIDMLCLVVAQAVIRAVADRSIASAPLQADDIGVAVALIVGTAASGAYRPGDAGRHIGRLFLAAALASALPVWSRVWGDHSLDALKSFVVAFGPLFVLLVLTRTAFDAGARAWSRRPGKSVRAVLLGTASDCLAELERTSLHGPADFEVLGFVDLAVNPHRRATGSVEDIEQILLDRDVEAVILCGLPNPATTTRVLRAAAVAECTVLASAPQLELPAVRPNVIKQRGQPLLELRPVGLRVEQLLLKRTVDIIGASAILLVLAPFLALIALLIRLDSPGPIVFVQRRLGRFGRPIRCYKFRSMHTDAEARLVSDPALFRLYVENNYKLPAVVDNRITRVGRFLRRMSFDELTQLWNVLKGEMSLVGPRPIVPDEIHHYNGEGPLLLSLKPGLTGEWQVSGRSTVPYPRRAEVELGYVEGWTLWRDVSILIRTIPAVLAARGAH
jgi:exopolysaccharide biosynthesis polyprenyl glycosylphosphotransferase